jgi:hypothetical protein
MKSEWIDYIMALVIEVNMEDKINRIDLHTKSIDELISVANQFEELYKMKRDSEALDLILNEVNEHGAEWVKEKYGLNKV